MAYNQLQGTIPHSITLLSKVLGMYVALTGSLTHSLTHSLTDSLTHSSIAQILAK
jgi:hypothetical protein